MLRIGNDIGQRIGIRHVKQRPRTLFTAVRQYHPASGVHEQFVFQRRVLLGRRGDAALQIPTVTADKCQIRPDILQQFTPVLTNAGLAGIINAPAD